MDTQVLEREEVEVHQGTDPPIQRSAILSFKSIDTEKNKINRPPNDLYTKIFYCCVFVFVFMVFVVQRSELPSGFYCIFCDAASTQLHTHCSCAIDLMHVIRTINVVDV